MLQENRHVSCNKRAITASAPMHCNIAMLPCAGRTLDMLCRSARHTFRAHPAEGKHAKILRWLGLCGQTGLLLHILTSLCSNTD